MQGTTTAGVTSASTQTSDGRQFSWTKSNDGSVSIVETETATGRQLTRTLNLGARQGASDVNYEFDTVNNAIIVREYFDGQGQSRVIPAEIDATSGALTAVEQSTDKTIVLNYSVDPTSGAVTLSKTQNGTTQTQTGLTASNFVTQTNQ